MGGMQQRGCVPLFHALSPVCNILLRPCNENAVEYRSVFCYPIHHQSAISNSVFFNLSLHPKKEVSP